MKIPTLVACITITILCQGAALAADPAPHALLERRVHALPANLSRIEFSRFSGEFLVFKTGEGEDALETVERRSSPEFVLLEEVDLPEGFDQLVQVSAINGMCLGVSESGGAVAFDPSSKEILWTLETIVEGKSVIGFGQLDKEVVLMSASAVEVFNVETETSRETVGIEGRFEGTPVAALGPDGRYLTLYEHLSRDTGQCVLLDLGSNQIETLARPFSGSRFFFNGNGDRLFVAGIPAEASPGDAYYLYEIDLGLATVLQELEIGETENYGIEYFGANASVDISPEDAYLVAYFEGEARVVDLGAWEVKSRPVVVGNLEEWSGDPYFVSEQELYVNSPERGFLETGIFEGQAVSVELANRDEEIWIDFESIANRRYLLGVSDDLLKWTYDPASMVQGDGERDSMKTGESFPQYNRVFEFDIPL